MKILSIFILTVLLIACSSVHKSNKDTVDSLVILKVEVLTDGTVGAIEVIKSVMSGQCMLGEAAVKSVKKWKFSPAKKNGKPVNCRVTIPITFNLD